MSEATSTDTEKKAFFDRAQDAVGSAVESTVAAVKDHPVAAAGIAAGVAAAAAGAAFGVNKLREDEKPVAKRKTGPKTKS